MPELPEVETISRQLDRVLAGRKIIGIQIRRDKSFLGQKDDLIGKTVEGMTRRSKMMIVSFRAIDKILVVHLKMTGQLIYIENSRTQELKNSRNQELKNSRRIVGGHPTPDWVNELPSKYTRVIIDFDNGAKLFFNDLRVFGWLRIFSKKNWEKLSAKLPPDVTSREFTLEYFAKALGKSARAIKLVLMDQAKFGGVGNIYANDALYKAKIDPRRKAKDLTDKEIKELFLAVKEVIAEGIKYGGASVDKYVDAAGVGGKYQEHFLIYGRGGEKCKRDGETIIKIKLGGRGTYYCPVCQK